MIISLRIMNNKNLMMVVKPRLFLKIFTVIKYKSIKYLKQHHKPAKVKF